MYEDFFPFYFIIWDIFYCWVFLFKNAYLYNLISFNFQCLIWANGNSPKEEKADIAKNHTVGTLQSSFHFRHSNVTFCKPLDAGVLISRFCGRQYRSCNVRLSCNRDLNTSKC